MTTQSSSVSDLFLARVADYRLDNIYTASGSFVLNSYLEPFLIDAIQKFSLICDQDLTTYVPTSGSVEGYFTEDLTLENQSILSRLMTESWMGKSIRTTLSMENHINDREFKLFSASQNLTAKQNYYSSLLEENDLILTKYAYHRNNWSDWNNQLFSG